MLQNSLTNLPRRLMAFLIDLVILSGIGFILGFFFFWEFASLGQSGIIIGYLIAALYFIPLHSIFGQTIGKAILNLQVMGKDGEKILPAYACLRFFFISIPFALLGLTEIHYTSHYTELTAKTATLALPLIMAYLLIFNLRTGQTVHDYLSASYVMHTDGYEMEESSNIWPMHFIVCAIIAASSLGYILYSDQKIRTPEYLNLQQAEQQIQKLAGIRHAQILAEDFTIDLGIKSITVNITPAINRNLVKLIKTGKARVFLIPDTITDKIKAIPDDKIDKENITINVKIGYDIGIARSWKYYPVKTAPKIINNDAWVPWMPSE